MAAEAPRARLAAELVLLYAALPFALYVAVTRLGLPLYALLFALLPAILFFVGRQPGHSWRRLLRRPPRREAGRILLLWAGAAALLLAWLLAFEPWSLFGLPRERPALWLGIVLFYPFVSALPQELAYRVLFFSRYAPLFGRRTGGVVIANAALFALAHIIFGSLVSVAGTFLLGLVIAARYARDRNFLAAWLEHTLYGVLVFTIGFGRHFYLSAGG